MNHILSRFADEDAGCEIRAEQVIAVRGRAVGRGQIVGRLGPVEALLWAAEGKDAC